MKQLLILILCSVVAMNSLAQTDTTEVKMLKKNVVTVVENNDGTLVKVGEDRGVEVITDEWGDTTKIRVGRRTFNVVDNWNGTHVNISKEPKQKKWTGSFNPHWAGLEVGVNVMTQTDYSVYNGTPYENYGDFMDLNVGKSLSWNLNIMEFAFKNERRTFGVVTGLGFSFNDYVFNDKISVEKQSLPSLLVPYDLPPNNDGNSIKKSKLHVNYLTAPLMLEIKTPLRMGGSHLYVAGGVIGSLYLGSYTKYKYYKGNKEKSHGGYNINQWKYELTGRLGFGDFCVFANYSMTPLFKDGQGPEVYPLMIGVSFPNI